MTAALYCRVSTRDQQNDNQADQLKAYAASRGYHITGVYSDTESGSRHQRPGLAALLRDASARKFDIVLFWSLDRISRGGVLKTLEILQLFQRYGVRFRSLQQPELDTTGPWGDVIVAVFAALAQLERMLLIERTRAGIERARRSGKDIGRPRRILNTDTVHELRAAGRTMAEIAARLGVSESTVYRRIQPRRNNQADAPATIIAPAPSSIVCSSSFISGHVNDGNDQPGAG
ncbi:MAG: recombinase family protein [Bryobacterales bacterium]|nr:recombinase family protein [Bryobacterales bacterium]